MAAAAPRGAGTAAGAGGGRAAPLPVPAARDGGHVTVAPAAPASRGPAAAAARAPCCWRGAARRGGGGGTWVRRPGPAGQERGAAAGPGAPAPPSPPPAPQLGGGGHRASPARGGAEAAGPERGGGGRPWAEAGASRGLREPQPSCGGGGRARRLLAPPQRPGAWRSLAGRSGGKASRGSRFSEGSGERRRTAVPSRVELVRIWGISRLPERSSQQPSAPHRHIWAKDEILLFRRVVFTKVKTLQLRC